MISGLTWPAFQVMGVAAQGLPDAMPPQWAGWCIKHVFQGVLHLSPSLALQYVPERFELRAWGLTVPLDTTECRAVHQEQVKISSVGHQPDALGILRLGNIQWSFMNEETLGHWHQVVMDSFTELRLTSIDALKAREDALAKKALALQQRAVALQLGNAQALYWSRLALAELA